MSTDSPKNQTPYRLKIAARDQSWIEAYKKGATLQEIALHAGVTRQCVYHRLKLNGLNRSNGGVSIRARSRSALRQKVEIERMEARSLRYWGCSRTEFIDTTANISHNQKTKLIKVYRETKRRAQREKAPWALSFPDFVHLMKDHIAFYGLERDKKVLHQIDRALGFEKNNLEVITLAESSSVKGIGKILTPRQVQVMELYDRGLGPTEIAHKLKLKPQGVQLIIQLAKKRRLFAGLEIERKAHTTA